STNLTDPTLAMVNALATLPEFTETSTPEPETWPLLLALLRQFPLLYSIYAGYDDGNYLQAASTQAVSGLSGHLAPPPGAANRIGQIHVVDGRRIEDFAFLDSDGNVLERRRDDRGLNYDPRARPWYADAASPGAGVFIGPYLFANGGLGYTARAPLAG